MKKVSNCFVVSEIFPIFAAIFRLFLFLSSKGYIHLCNVLWLQRYSLLSLWLFLIDYLNITDIRHGFVCKYLIFNRIGKY